MSKRFKQPSDGLEQEEILAALAASGYPLEIRLLRAFTDGGMDPIIGFRVSDLPGESREIDLIAHFTRSVPVSGGYVIQVALRLLIEAKSLEPGAAFVGFPWTRPSDHDLRVGRARFGGAPSYRVDRRLEQDDQTVVGPGGLGEAFDSMNASPTCVQWAVARRTKPGQEQRTIATHDDIFWQGIDGIVRSSHTLMTEHSTHPWPKDVRLIVFEMPVLVVGTTNLWVFDATNPTPASALTSASRITLTRMFQVGPVVQDRLVDVVSEGGVPEFIEACRVTIDELEKRVGRHAAALIGLAQRQRSKLEELELEEAATAFERGGIFGTR
jgi:hypothetical protein